MRTSLLGVALVLALTRVSSATDYSVKTYNVSGTTPSQILAAVKANGPKGFAGSTDLAAPAYSLDFQEKGGKCVTNGTIDTYEITVTLPNWTDAGSSDQCVIDSYNKMRDALTQHEERHVKIFRDAKDSLTAAISGVNLPGSCSDSTRSKLKAASEKALAATQVVARKKSDDFDVKTKHGLSDSPPVILDSCP
ncbi:DUF922 domain-containing Zn-dependent protease [Mesorhizobium muleiense]|uniref:DUF922 domain-containing protein n=1 Tax=Mesorhizobium muleiense TaxID=1004279 RepID=UPI001F481D0A|nr:DUF922 domain-containing protein [Mesorhizobium muleiense]MCF6117113.1 DUF922 domain-containing Zn-dependent protease [Mesorhizobium muleiense]